MIVAHSRGEQEVNIGDRFRMIGGEVFEVVRLTGSMYGPSGLGGTPVFKCRQHAGERYPADYYDADDLIELCGDSIAASIAGYGRLAPQPAGSQHESA